MGISKERTSVLSLLIVLTACALTIALSIMLANEFGPENLTGRTKQIVIRRRSYYAVQTAAFPTEAAAKENAEKLQEKGGGGYIMYDSLYRVTAAVYASRSDADTVVANLAANGTEAVIYIVDIPQKRVNLEITSAQKRALNAALNCFTEAYETLYDLSAELDTSASNVIGAVTRIKSFRDGAAVKLNSLAEINTQTAAVIKAELNALVNGMDELCGVELTAGRLSVLCKYTYTKTVAVYARMAREM